MKIVTLDESSEKIFHDHVSQDPLQYYFFILDWQQRKEQTKILLAMEEEKIQGMMLLYSNYIVQLRGKRNAVEAMFSQVDLEKVEMQAPLDCEDLIFAKYRSSSPSNEREVVLMSVKRGEENLQITTTPTRLNTNDAEETIKLMAEADPEWWGELTTDMMKKTLETGFWLGIKEKQELVSVGGTRFVDFASNISTIATDKNHRNKGYATSIVSALVQEIFKHSPAAIIHVMRHNTPAVRAYSKVGFKPYQNYLLLKGEKIKA